MKNLFMCILFFCCSLARSADDTGDKISLSVELSKTDIHHLEPIAVKLKITNRSKEDFILKASMICSLFDTRISFGDLCATNVQCLNGGVITRV